jgi:hypothetical protein
MFHLLAQSNYLIEYFKDIKKYLKAAFSLNWFTVLIIYIPSCLVFCVSTNIYNLHLHKWTEKYSNNSNLQLNFVLFFTFLKKPIVQKTWKNVNTGCTCVFTIYCVLYIGRNFISCKDSEIIKTRLDFTNLYLAWTVYKM